MESSLPGQVGKDEASLFDGIDTSLNALAQYAGTNPPQGLVSALAGILAEGKRAQAAFAAGDDAGTAAPVEAGLAAVRALNCLRSASPTPRCTKSNSASTSRIAIIRTPCWPPMA
jgi:hypothetical protein